MGALENKPFTEIDALPASKTFFVAFCARNQVTTSETRMAQAKGGKDYGSEQIIALLNQVSRLKKFRDSMSPLPIKFDDADVMTNLVNDFEAGKLSITVNRFEEIQLIRKVYWIEFTADQKLFGGILGGDMQKTGIPGEAACIADERTAQAARDILVQMGRSCRVTDGRMRIAESRLIKNLVDLGFQSEPAA